MCRLSTSLRKSVALHPGQRTNSPSGTPRLGRPSATGLLLSAVGCRLSAIDDRLSAVWRSAAHTADLSQPTSPRTSSSIWPTSGHLRLLLYFSLPPGGGGSQNPEHQAARGGRG